MGGQRVKFLRGAFDVNQKAAKLVENHDLTQLRGVVNALARTPQSDLSLKQRWPTRGPAATQSRS
jgi:hypothetical protein